MSDDIKEIEKIDKTLIREALKRIKPGKTDPILDFSSDFIKNGPDILLEKLAELIQSFLMHGIFLKYYL